METIAYLCEKGLVRYFETRFLEEAEQFLATLESKARKKVIYNLDLAEQSNDPRLFKKLKDDIWEFRVRYMNYQIRLLAFWDKSDHKHTLVIATHGFVKKASKIPDKEIERAVTLRSKYFASKM